MPGRNKQLAPRKRVRYMTHGTVVIEVKGQTPEHGIKAFKFKTLSDRQLMRRRNNAYKYFSIA
jgi:hypothetical protein